MAISHFQGARMILARLWRAGEKMTPFLRTYFFWVRFKLIHLTFFAIPTILETSFPLKALRYFLQYYE